MSQPASQTSTVQPEGKAAPSSAKPTRRWFVFSWFQAAWAAFTATMTAWFLWTLRFLFPNASMEPPMTFKAGYPDQYEDDKVVERFKEEYGVWIVRLRTPKGVEIFALSTVCTHLGCTPNWLENEQKFKCPCHGSGFMKDGTNFEGPAPRPLERYRIVLAEDGQILVDKSRKFQKELGQWNDPEAAIRFS